MSSRTVLIVDDDISVRDRLTEMLSDEGFMAIATGNSVEALKLAEERGPGVALLDAELPDGEGTKLVSELQGLNPDWICAMLTPDSDLDSAISAHELGAYQYLKKPLDPMALVTHLRILFDISRMRAQNRDMAATLRETEARFKAVCERSLDLIHIKDRKLRYTYINPAAERYFGLNANEMIGRTDQQLFRSGGASPGEMEEHRVLRGAVHEEDLVSSFGGSEFYHYVTRLPVQDSHGDVSGILTIGRDVTERKMLEKKLVQAQKMEAIGVLAGGIAHDFNNILGAVLGHVELAQLMENRGRPAVHHLDEVLKATKRASDLVKQILAFTRRDDQKLVPIELAPIVRECMQLIRAALPTTITIEQYIENDVCVAMANPTHIHQVIMNLATNAAHAMSNQRGTLIVRLSHGDDRGVPESAKQKPLGPYVEISVEDNGRGMPPDTVKEIFTPYFTTKAEGEGTGLGLAVVHDIVKRSGGTVTVASVLGRGSVFRVRLPRVNDAAEAAIEVDRPLPVGKECILYVDDEAALVEIGQNLFERLGYTVIGMTSPLDALAYYHENPESIDVVLTDQTMPNMTGVELAREVRKVREDIPVMICSGFAASPEYDAARDFRNVTFLRKPVVMREFAETVRRVLDSRKSE